jgi:TonB-dependent starch-binding outer membrane protein SusC
MKKKQIGEVWYDHTLFKAFRIMRLTLGLLLVIVVQGWAINSYSQKTVINLNMKNADLINVLEEIEHQTEFNFLYNYEQVHSDKKMDVKLSNTKIDEILNLILKGTDLKYTINDRQIVITKDVINQSINLPSITSQQFRTIKGKVSDKTGIGLPGVSVVVKGTTLGVLTDGEGNFSLKIPSDAKILSLSFVGMKKYEVAIEEKTTFTVVLEEETIGIEEVVAIGYGSVKKSDLTGSVSSIKSAELNSIPTLRLDQALKGKISGLQAIATSSAPGSATSIRIRGSNSISANNEPLYVIDGFIGGFDLNDINVNNIESIEVLKDASATAIYGSRGSNGVILITTKRGKEGKTKISYDSYFSYQSPSRLIPVLNASEFAAYMNEVKGVQIFPNPASYGEGTNWQKEVYRENVPMTSHTLSLVGGDKNHKYFMSGNYFSQEGISINSNLERYHFQINTDHVLSNKLKVGNSLFISRRMYKPGVFGAGIKNIGGWQPTLPVKDAEGKYTIQTEFAEVDPDNPVAIAMLSIDNTTTSKLLGTIYGEYEIIKGLTYKLNLGANLESGKRQRYLPSTLYLQQAYQGTATINNNETLDIIIENTLNFIKNFGKHNIGGLLGYTRQKINTTSDMVETRNFVTDAFTFNNLGAGAERTNAGSNSTEQGLESYLFRTNYGYNNKYLFTASARLDGASVFAENNKWALFPSAAFAWKAENEEFIKRLKIFDNLKLRTSIGLLGNPGLNPGASLSKLSQTGNNYILGTDQHVVSGIAANTLGNPDLKWESTTQFDIGVDAGFFNRRLQVSLDYYDKLTKDLLVDVPLLWLTSFVSVLTNFGTISNKGIELSLTSININKKDFKWETNLNISSNKNKIVSIIAPEGYILNNSFTWSGASGIIKVGEPIGTFYGLEMDGIWNTKEEITESGLSGFSVFPGGKRYKDLNGDKVISPTLDNTIIGHADPDFYGGFSNRFTYKAFDLYVYFSFVYGNEIYNETARIMEQALDNNVYRKFANRWTPTNTSSDIPSVPGIVRSMNVSNSGFVEDGSFIRLQDIRLTYNVPVKKINWITSAQFFIAGNNLLLFDKYSGYDPEINRGFDNTKRGYDHSQDPTIKSYTLGLKIDF